MLLNDEQIRMYIYHTQNQWQIVSEKVFNISLDKLISETEEYGLYGPVEDYEKYLKKLNKLFVDINECFISLQNKDKLRLKIKEKKDYTEVKIFLNSEIHDRKTYSKSNYVQMYLNLIPYYKLPSERKLLEYKSIKLN
tara:strand:- start:2116 stop:2529 length:414 start_codon:yes stop_codon:yes gene_type:complete